MLEVLLQLLTFSVFLFALWRKSYSAMWFGFLTLGHSALLGGYAQSDPLFWMITGAISSTLSIAGCYYLRRGIRDTIAFWMTGISLACLATNIICIITWYYEYSMEGFSYVFAGILLASLIAIGKGDKGELGRGEDNKLSPNIYDTVYKRSGMVVRVANGQAFK